MRQGYKKDGRIDLRRLPRIVERRLGQEQAEGQATQLLHSDAGGDRRPPSGPPLLELDTKLHGKPALEAAVHEALHLACPFMFENVVTQVARYLAMILWHLGYRRLTKAEMAELK